MVRRWCLPVSRNGWKLEVWFCYDVTYEHLITISSICCKIWLLLVLRQRKIFLWQTTAKLSFFQALASTPPTITTAVRTSLRFSSGIPISSAQACLSLRRYEFVICQNYVILYVSARSPWHTMWVVLQVPGGLGWYYSGHNGGQPPGHSICFVVA